MPGWVERGQLPVELQERNIQQLTTAGPDIARVKRDESYEASQEDNEMDGQGDYGMAQIKNSRVQRFIKIMDSREIPLEIALEAECLKLTQEY